MQITKRGRLENVGPTLQATATTKGTGVVWLCGCNARMMQEDFARGRLVCRRCGAAVGLDEAIGMAEGIVRELTEMVGLFEEEVGKRVSELAKERKSGAAKGRKSEAE